MKGWESRKPGFDAGLVGAAHSGVQGVPETIFKIFERKHGGCQNKRRKDRLLCNFITLYQVDPAFRNTRNRTIKTSMSRLS